MWGLLYVVFCILFCLVESFFVFFVFILICFVCLFFLQVWSKIWTSDKFVSLGKSASYQVFTVQQWPDGDLVVSFPSKRGAIFLLDVILKMRCSCTLVKPHHKSETTSSTNWAGFWRFGHDKEWISFLGFWDHCSMEGLQIEPLTVPLASSPNPVLQSISYLPVPVWEGLQREEEPSLGGGTWGHGNLLESCWGMNSHGRMSGSWVTTEVICPGIFLSMILVYYQYDYRDGFPFFIYWQ